MSEREIADELKEGAERVIGENFIQVFQRLRKKMLPRRMRKQLKVDPEGQVMDVYSYYKSEDFDALVPMSVFVKGQPAIDVGYVLRQTYLVRSFCCRATIKASNVKEKDLIPPMRRPIIGRCLSSQRTRCIGGASVACQ